MDAKFKKILCGEPWVLEDNTTESDIFPCFRRSFDSFFNYLLSFHCFVQLRGIYFESGLTQNHAMKFDKHREKFNKF